MTRKLLQIAWVILAGLALGFLLNNNAADITIIIVAALLWFFDFAYRIFGTGPAK